MEWFRFYHEALDDPKVQQLPPIKFKYWVNLLCLSNQSTPRGTLPSIGDIAYRLRVSTSKAREIVDEFVGLRLLDRDDVTLQPHNWNGRQRVSDDVAIRVAKHRGNVTGNVTGNADVTVTRDRDRTDTDTEQTQSRVIPPIPPEGDDQKPRSVRTIKTPIPEDFSNEIPVDVFDAIQTEQGLSLADMNRETEKMVDHFRSKGERRVDWVATWRNWMRSDYRRPTPINGGRSSPNGRMSSDDIMAEAERINEGRPKPDNVFEARYQIGGNT